MQEEMKQQRRHSNPMTPRLRQIATILEMIDDLDRVAGLLDCEIATQEHHAKTVLPIRASLTSRRDNLRKTVAMLETRLADIRAGRDATASIEGVFE